MAPGPAATATLLLLVKIMIWIFWGHNIFLGDNDMDFWGYTIFLGDNDMHFCGDNDIHIFVIIICIFCDDNMHLR